MNREETLNYLQQKRSETADVAIAQQNLSAAQAKLNKASKKLSRTITTFLVIGIILLLVVIFSWSDDGLTGLPAVFLFGGIAVILMVFKNYH